MKDTIDIDEFVIITNKKEKTIRNNRHKIPGLKYDKGVYIIEKGTRYPCDLHRYKIKDSADRRYVLLKTISEYKYICNKDLKLYQEQFVSLLGELLEAGLISENNMPNHYGANAYDCTPKGDQLLKETKNKAKKEISNIVASAAGIFVGAVISEVAA